MVLETSLNIIEMLKFLTQWLNSCHSNSLGVMSFIHFFARFQPKNANIQVATKSTVLEITI